MTLRCWLVSHQAMVFARLWLRGKAGLVLSVWLTVWGPGREWWRGLRWAKGWAWQ